MLHVAFLTCILAAVCPSSTAVMSPVPDIGACGFDFVMEVSGASVERRFFTPESGPVCHTLPDGRSIQVEFLRVKADALGPCPRNLRMLIDASVGVTSGAVMSCSRAKLTIGADLTVTRGPSGELTLAITSVPETLISTSDACNAPEVEQLIAQAAPEIAQRLSVSIPLEGLGTLAAARPPGVGPVTADAYQLGFGWVLQIAGASRPEHGPAPSVFLQGDVFTLVVSKPMVQTLAAAQLATGGLPNRMNEKGLVDSNGSIRITGVTTDLEPGVVVLNWLGIGPDNKNVTITWRLAFVQEVAELALKVQQIVVNGHMACVPPDMEIINPIDEMVRNVATGPAKTTVMVGPMGRLRLTTGQICPHGIMVSGRV